MNKSIVFSLATLATFFAIQTSRAIVIADWTFETSQPATAGPFSPEIGSGSALGFHAGAATYSSPAGNGSAHSFSANTWALNDYFQFSVSTIGFQNIQLSFDQIASSTGPGKFLLQYSINGVSFTPFGSDYTVSTTSWATGTHVNTTTFNDDFSAIPGLNNAPNVFFRLVADALITAGGSTVSSFNGAGASRIDNVIVSGSAISAPDQSSTLVLALLGISACFIFGRKTQRLA